MWVPNTDPSGSGLLANTRYRGQDGATETAAVHSHLGVLGVTGFLMKDLSANPLDYVEGGALKVLYNSYRRTGGGALAFELTGTALATFALARTPKMRAGEQLPCHG